MTNQDLDERLINLEAHVSHQDGIIDDLGDMIAQQWKLIDSLRSQLEGLKARVHAVEDRTHGGGAADNRPPHY